MQHKDVSRQLNRAAKMGSRGGGGRGRASADVPVRRIRARAASAKPRQPRLSRPSPSCAASTGHSTFESPPAPPSPILHRRPPIATLTADSSRSPPPAADHRVLPEHVPVQQAGRAAAAALLAGHPGLRRQDRRRHAGECCLSARSDCQKALPFFCCSLPSVAVRRHLNATRRSA
eukprot:SAG22_NODE_467_length_10171_cov_4.306295_7_plen_175_part_00